MGFFNSKKTDDKAPARSSAHTTQSTHSSHTSHKSEKSVVAQGKSTVPASIPSAGGYRSVFLLHYGSATFKAHWALFVPDPLDNRCKKGRKIHVAGSVKEGFKHEITRNCNLTLTRTKPETPLEIGIVSTQYIIEVAQDAKYGLDTTARDPFEELVLSVPAPNQSLNKASDQTAQTGPPRRVTLSDCQWWVMRVVEKLVAQGYMLPPTRGMNKGKSPLEILANAPKH
ncbi:hypothetical protein F5Y18DRAFT_307873 [Xylariaceae sp. FL1019]|nr:hypothetical protein F5Y18DRAFT_307873 [Xylariaceae sp. FL1019]